VPLLVVISHVIAVAYLSSTVGLGLYKSWTSLSPSQDTRPRLARRAKLVPIFASLAGIGLLLGGYSAAKFATLSYQVWADELGISIPDTRPLFATTTPPPPVHSNLNATQIHYARWLSDTPIYYDALEIVAEKARRFWWGQQVELAMVPWSMLLAIEGRRRRIPFLAAYLALAHLVNLSYAQNLFYVALLLTPAPIPGADLAPTNRYVSPSFMTARLCC